ncbi:RDD family protein [Chitinophaga cymbidii]|uniref:RDD domain-containing protein n=1 Tax=Chitinophaga cymbidii TaxID=1096750 RepID=A0A512RGX5_9BACT|nr:RDD family protein [Chitinophaga cymbidii]GEP94953.1 hypothetical protein CCY01nite_12130 [Chitinophaga cymbidii]
MSIIKIPTAFNIDLEFEVADFGRRLAAYVIDLLIRIAYVALMSWLIYRVIGVEGDGDMPFFIFVMLPVSLYYLISEMLMSGQSLGKKVMSLKVVSILGNTPGISQILLRWMFRLVESPLLSFVLLGAAMQEESGIGILLALGMAILPLVIVLRSPYNQRLGDITAGTIVVRNQQKASIDDTIFREINQENYVPQFSQVLRLSDRDLGKIKAVLDNAYRTKNAVMASRIAARVQEVLHIETDMEPVLFLETLLNDYNYLVTRD